MFPLLSNFSFSSTLLPFPMPLLVVGLLRRGLLLFVLLQLGRCHITLSRIILFVKHIFTHVICSLGSCSLSSSLRLFIRALVEGLFWGGVLCLSFALLISYSYLDCLSHTSNHLGVNSCLCIPFCSGVSRNDQSCGHVQC